MNVTISVITPVYNSAQFLVQTIESVINQSYTDWELILVDDCSTDNSREIIKSYASKDSRIKTILLEKNQGAGVTRNLGLDEANGKYITFLDSDDYWDEHKLENQIKHLESNPTIQFAYTWYINVDEQDTKLSYSKVPGELSFTRLSYNNYILTSSIIVKSEIAKQCKFSLMRRRQDWVYFLELLKLTKKAYCLAEKLVYYRKSSNSLSSNKLSLVKPNFEFFRQYLYSGNAFMAALHFIVFLPFYFHNKIFNKKVIDN